MYSHGKFTKPGAVKSTGEKTPPASTPHEKEHGQAQSPHGGGGMEHVTKTHPGKTQPHPVTGVHAFHGNHMGGGKYESHTHHDGGEVETRQHGSADEMHQAMKEALPGDAEMDQRGADMTGSDFSGALDGIGGGGMTE